MGSIRLAALALALAVPSMAAAGTYHLQYTTFADSLFPAVTVNAFVTTDDGSFYGAPGYLVTGISGTRGGVAIDGLTDPYSEIFFPGTPIVDDFGLTFSSGGFDYQLVRNNQAFYNEFGTPSSGGFSEGRLVFDSALTLTAVPEPATWTLLIGGFALIGTGLRRARAHASRLV